MNLGNLVLSLFVVFLVPTTARAQSLTVKELLLREKSCLFQIGENVLRQLWGRGVKLDRQHLSELHKTDDTWKSGETETAVLTPGVSAYSSWESSCHRNVRHCDWGIAVSIYSGEDGAALIYISGLSFESFSLKSPPGALAVVSYASTDRVEYVDRAGRTDPFLDRIGNFSVLPKDTSDTRVQLTNVKSQRTADLYINPQGYRACLRSKLGK